MVLMLWLMVTNISKVSSFCHLNQVSSGVIQCVRLTVQSTTTKTANHESTFVVSAAPAVERYTILPSRGWVGLKMSVMGCPVQNRHCRIITSSWSRSKIRSIRTRDEVFTGKNKIKCHCLFVGMFKSNKKKKGFFKCFRHKCYLFKPLHH